MPFFFGKDSDNGGGEFGGGGGGGGSRDRYGRDRGTPRGGGGTTGGGTTGGGNTGSNPNDPYTWDSAWGQQGNPWTKWPDDVFDYTKTAGTWFRNPGNPDHLVWNDYYGWQNYRTVLEQMRTGKPMEQWDLKRQGGMWTPEMLAELGLDPNKVGPGSAKRGGDGGGGAEGWWDFPPEMKEYYDLLLGKGKDLIGRSDDIYGRGVDFFDRPTGFDQGTMDRMFGKNFDFIRGGEAGQREQAEGILSRQGMAGTGQELDTMGDIGWGTSQSIADLSRDLFVQNELKKKQDLLDYTQAGRGLIDTSQNLLGSSQDIFDQGMGYNQLIEVLNAARRGEGQDAMNALMAWIASLSWE